MFRKVALSAAVLVTLVGLAPATASARPADSCAVTWGSGVKSVAVASSAPMTDLRAGRHECFDRLVFDFQGSANGYWVSYVDRVSAEGSGAEVPVRGGARMQVSVHAPAHDGEFRPTYVFDNPAELVDVTGYQTFRQVAWAGTQHGTTSVGLGVRARLPFRVFTQPDRIVVDVAHQW